MEKEKIKESMSIVHTYFHSIESCIECPFRTSRCELSLCPGDWDIKEIEKLLDESEK